MFKVIQKWANLDSEKRLEVAQFESREEAVQFARVRTAEQPLPWSVFVVEEA